MTKGHGMAFGIMGRSEWLYDVAEHLIACGHKLKFVVTAKEAPEYHRGVQDFQRLADQHDAAFHRFANLDNAEAGAFLDAFRDVSLVISINFPTVISEQVINRFKLGVLNAHGGDLPRYRGNACQAWAILNGEKQIAMCVHKMQGGQLDSGDILAREYMPIDLTTKVGDIYAWFGTILPKLFEATLEALHRDPDFVLEVQSTAPEDALRCYPRRPEDGRIDWCQPAVAVLRLVNASGWPYSGAFTSLDGEEVKILDAELVDDSERYLAIPGQIAHVDKDNGSVVVVTGEGKLRVKLVVHNDVQCLPVQIVKSIRQRFV